MSAATRQFRRRLLSIGPPEIEEALCRRIATYSGSASALESALGALVIGQHYGTRTLRMTHSPGTIRKYEAILGVRFEAVCPSEFTPLSERVVGIRAARRLGGYWDVVMGRKKVKKKGWIDDAADSSTADSSAVDSSTADSSAVESSAADSSAAD